MAVAAAYTLHGVNIQTTGGTDLYLDGIQDWSLSSGLSEMLMTGDGNVNPTFAAIASQSPGMSFSTIKVANALATVGMNGLKIDSDVDDDGLEAWFSATAEGGTRTAASSTKLTVNEGLLVPTTLTADGDGPAVLNYALSITYDGTNDPIVFAATTTTEGTATAETYHVLGPIKINGTTLTGIQSCSVNFGHSVRVLRGEGELWPTFAYVQAAAPSITFRTLDVDVVRSLITIDGVAQSTTDSVVYFRKTDVSGRVADGTGEHISLTVDDGLISWEGVGGNPELGLDVTIRPVYDGTAAILVISTSSTIT